MYSITIPNVEQFGEFLNSTDVGWVDIVLTTTGALFLQSTSSILTAFQCSCARSSAEIDRAIRVKTSVLKLVFGLTEMEFVFSEEHLTISFLKDQSIVRKVRVPLSKAFVSSLQERMAIMRDRDGFDASCLKSSIKISKFTGSLLEVNGGMLTVCGRDGTIIARKVDGIPDLCLDNSAAVKLFQCNEHWCRCENYVYAVKGHYGVIVTQCRGNNIYDSEDLFEDESGSAAIIRVDLSEFFKMLRSVKSSTVMFDFVDGSCSFTDGDTEYMNVVRVLDRRIAERFKEQSLILPKKIIEILANSGTTEITLSIKKYHLRIETDEFIIFTGRVRNEN